ncbi:MAG: phage portal protein, partial [Bradyrhizobium sp.]|nr:phage portal protein [Bradyrhizobium sp.]
MGVLTQMIERRTPSAEDDFWYRPIWSTKETNAGVAVDRDTALRCATVMACVRVLAETISSLPLHVYRRRKSGGRDRVYDHWMTELFNWQVNHEMGAYQWRESSMSHLLLYGNAYSEMLQSGRGQTQLWMWNPERVTVSRSDSGRLRYTLGLVDGTERTFGADKVFHVPGLGWNGLVGLAVLDYARETIGTALAEEEYAARFFGAGANPGLVVTTPPDVRRS